MKEAPESHITFFKTILVGAGVRGSEPPPKKNKQTKNKRASEHRPTKRVSSEDSTPHHRGQEVGGVWWSHSTGMRWDDDISAAEIYRQCRSLVLLLEASTTPPLPGISEHFRCLLGPTARPGFEVLTQLLPARMFRGGTTFAQLSAVWQVPIGFNDHMISAGKMPPLGAGEHPLDYDARYHGGE